MDYISDNFIRTVTCKDGKIVTSGGASYKALIIPGAKLMPSDVLQKLYKLTEQGAKIVFLDQYPEDVPGYMNLEKRRSDFKSTLAQIKVKTQEGRVLFGTDYVKTLAATSVVPEVLKNTFGLSYIRRANETGYHYFISALKGEDTEGWVPLAVDARSAMAGISFVGCIVGYTSRK